MPTRTKPVLTGTQDKNQRHRPCAYCVRSAKGGCDTGQTAYMSIPKVGKELMLARARAKELSQHVAAIRAKQSNAPRQSDLGQQSPSFATSDSEDYVPRPTRRPRAKQPDAPSRQSNLGQDSLLSAISDSEDDVVRPTKRRRTCMMTTSTVDVVNVGALAKSIDTIQYEDEDSDSSELSKLDSTIAFDHTIEPALIKTEIADESRAEANGGDARPLQNGADPIRAGSITRTIPVSLLSQPVHMMQQQNEGDSSSTTILAAPEVHERNSTQQQANNNNNNNNSPPPSNNTARDRLILRAVTQARNSFWPRVAELVNFGLEQPDHHHHHHQLTAEEVKQAYERIDVTDRALLG